MLAAVLVACVVAGIILVLLVPSACKITQSSTRAHYTAQSSLRCSFTSFQEAWQLRVVLEHHCTTAL